MSNQNGADLSFNTREKVKKLALDTLSSRIISQKHALHAGVYASAPPTNSCVSLSTAMRSENRAGLSKQSLHFAVSLVTAVAVGQQIENFTRSASAKVPIETRDNNFFVFHIRCVDTERQ